MRWFAVFAIIVIVVILIDIYPATRGFVIGAGVTIVYILGRDEHDDTH